MKSQIIESPLALIVYEIVIILIGYLILIPLWVTQPFFWTNRYPTVTITLLFKSDNHNLLFLFTTGQESWPKTIWIVTNSSNFIRISHAA